MSVFEKIRTWIGLIGGLLAQWLGGWDIGLQTLLACMGIDFICGLIVAGMGKSTKTESGALSSGALVQGLFKKGQGLMLVLLGTLLKAFTGMVWARDGMILALIIGEVVSIAEKYSLTGYPVPTVLAKILDVLKAREDAPDDKGE